jgi:hypothetical protein
MKLSKEQISEIQRLRKEGKQIKDIAKQFKVSENLIGYWSGRKEKVLEWQRNYQKNLSKEKKKSNYNKKKEYFKKYFRERYQNDEVFREKVKARNRKK